MNAPALIGLGSNLGDRRALLDAAVAALDSDPDLSVQNVSRYRETLPAGGPPGQGPFLNAAAAIETSLHPLSLLRQLQAIEQEAGRARTVRWGERTLDLDLLLLGETVLDTPELTLPHPRMAVRGFVLRPLEEIAPMARDPHTGQTIRALLANIDRRPSYLALEGWWRDPEKRPALERLVEQLGTFCWSLSDFRRLSPQRHRDAAAIDVLVPGRWSMLGERWLVTDFTRAELPAPRSPLARLRDRTRRLIEPTFIVVESQPPGNRLAERPIARAIPRLRLSSTDPFDQAAEILAACTASRT